jgi:hypothetical protein
MATVDAPLFSFGASGQLAKALVYFPWKGLKCVRSYVRPANPETTDQEAQRTKLHTGVDYWHTTGLTAGDITAWNALAAIDEKPQSGFNKFVASVIAILQAGGDTDMCKEGTLATGGAGTFTAICKDSLAKATSGFFDWGYSPTALLTSDALAEAPASTWTLAAEAATVGAWVYGRFRLIKAGLTVGRTGIYKFKVV